MQYKASVLFVDNIGLGRSISFILRRKGYIAISTSDTFEATKICEERAFDIVFIDANELAHSFEALKRIKRVRPEIRVVMTAHESDSLAQEALKEGADGIIYKPLDLRRIIGLIENAQPPHLTPEVR